MGLLENGFLAQVPDGEVADGLEKVIADLNQVRRALGGSPANDGAKL